MLKISSSSYTTSPMDPLQWMGGVRIRVQTADKNITHLSSPSIRKGRKGREAMCALHLTHPSAHTQQWVVNKHTHTHTHTRSSGQPMLRRPGSSWGFGALLKGLTSVVVLRVEKPLDIHSPHLQSLPDLRLEPATFGLQVRLSNH